MKPLFPATAALLVTTAAPTHPRGGPEGPEPAGWSPAWTTVVANENVTVDHFGRIQADWLFGTGDDSFGEEDGVEFRRARMGVKGTLFELVDYKAELDFAGGDADFTDVFLSVSDTPVGQVKVGHFKEPFSIEELTSSRFLTFAERSVANAFSPARNMGIQVGDVTENERLGWAVGVFRDTDSAGEDTGEGEGSVTGRVYGTPWYEDDGACLLHVGGAASYREDDDGVESFSARPEAHILSSVAGTGTFAADDTVLANAEAAWVHGPASIQAEYTLAMVNAPSGMSDADFHGHYIEGSYFLTGEHRSYKPSSGSFDRVKPHRNVMPGDWSGGAWQVAARYSGIDLNDGPSSDELENLSFGLKWILNPNVRILANYIFSQFESGSIDDEAHLVVLRFQVDW